MRSEWEAPGGCAAPCSQCRLHVALPTLRPAKRPRAGGAALPYGRPRRRRRRCWQSERKCSPSLFRVSLPLSQTPSPLPRAVHLRHSAALSPLPCAGSWRCVRSVRLWRRPSTWTVTGWGSTPTLGQGPPPRAPTPHSKLHPRQARWSNSLGRRRHYYGAAARHRRPTRPHSCGRPAPRSGPAGAMRRWGPRWQRLCAFWLLTPRSAFPTEGRRAAMRWRL